MKIGVIRFPGTNCDRDVYHAIELAGAEAEYIWWKDEKLTEYKDRFLGFGGSTIITDYGRIFTTYLFKFNLL